MLIEYSYAKSSMESIEVKLTTHDMVLNTLKYPKYLEWYFAHLIMLDYVIMTCDFDPDNRQFFAAEFNVEWKDDHGNVVKLFKVRHCPDDLYILRRLANLKEAQLWREAKGVYMPYDQFYQLRAKLNPFTALLEYLYGPQNQNNKFENSRIREIFVGIGLDLSDSSESCIKLINELKYVGKDIYKIVFIILT